VDQDQRIAQFKQMAEADPNNELGHFSLGKAYFDAGRFGEACGPLRRALQLNPMLSKAYQWLGDALDRDGKRSEAVEVLTRGVAVADEQGDRMPRNTMAETLRGWGSPVPLFKNADRPADASTGGVPVAGFHCSRCGRPDAKLAKQPFKGPLGQKIFDNVCTNCWREWIPMGTKVINELALVLSTPSGQQMYDQYMQEFLQLEGR